jgi:cobalamin transport system ATP-binding protein
MPILRASILRICAIESGQSGIKMKGSQKKQLVKRTAIQAVLSLHSLTIGYRATRRQTTVVAEDISASLGSGELVCLLGPNGAGKSTLLRTVAGMQAPLGGEVRLDAENIHRMPARELSKRLSVVLTERIWADALSGYELVALGRHPYTNLAGVLRERDHAIIRWALETVGAAEFAQRSIGELSDGERQRVMVARALAQEPRVMVLDEITAFLDLPRRVEMMRLLREMAHTTGRAILLSTHDLDLALRSADRIWLLEKGRRLHTGAPEDLILRNVFAEVFASEGVKFNRERGAFEIGGPPRGEIGLIGDGEEAFWTTRALEREGYLVRHNGCSRDLPAQVKVTRDESGRMLWQLVMRDSAQGHESLYDLVTALREERGNMSSVSG